MNRQRTSPTTNELFDYIGELGKEITELKEEIRRLNERINASARYHMMLDKRITKLERK